jgi:hypothetical protein
MDFRDITDRLVGATIDSHSVDLANGIVELASPSISGGAPQQVKFEGVAILKWTSSTNPCGRLSISVIGLEKLGPGEPWRLYIRTSDGGELELTCRSVRGDGEEVTGIGRSYRH